MHTARLIYAYSGLLGAPIKHWPERDELGARIPRRWSQQGIVLVDPDGRDDIPPLVWHATWPRGFHCVTRERVLGRYVEHEVVSFNVRASFEEQRDWCEARDGMKYAFGTLIGMALGLSSPQAMADHCAEVNENALRDWDVIGAPRWSRPHHLISPNRSHHNLIGVMK